LRVGSDYDPLACPVFGHLRGDQIYAGLSKVGVCPNGLHDLLPRAQLNRDDRSAAPREALDHRQQLAARPFAGYRLRHSQNIDRTSAARLDQLRAAVLGESEAGEAKNGKAPGSFVLGRDGEGSRPFADLLGLAACFVLGSPALQQAESQQGAPAAELQHRDFHRIADGESIARLVTEEAHIPPLAESRIAAPATV